MLLRKLLLVGELCLQETGRCLQRSVAGHTDATAARTGTTLLQRNADSETHMKTRLLDEIHYIAVRHASYLDAVYCHYAIAHLELPTTIRRTAGY